MGRKVELRCKNCQHTFQVKMGSGEDRAVIGYYRCSNCSHLWPKTIDLTSEKLPEQTIKELKLLNPKIEIKSKMTPRELDTISEVLAKEVYILNDRLLFWKCKVLLNEGIKVEGLEHALDLYQRNLEKIEGRMAEQGLSSKTREYFQSEVDNARKELQKEESLVKLIKIFFQFHEDISCPNCASNKITRWIPFICPKCGEQTRKRHVYSWQ